MLQKKNGKTGEAKSQEKTTEKKKKQTEQSEPAENKKAKKPKKEKKPKEPKQKKQLTGLELEDTYSFSQDWVNYSEAIYGMAKTKDGRYVRIVEIEPITFLLRTKQERADIISGLYTWLKIAPVKLQFRTETCYVDSAGFAQEIIKMTEGETNALVLKRREELIEHIRLSSRTDAISKKFYVIYEYEPKEGQPRQTDEVEIYKAMEQTRLIMKNYFEQMGNHLVEHDNENLFVAKMIYHALNPRSSVDETIENRIQRIVDDTTAVTMLRDQTIPDPASICEDNFVAPRGLSLENPKYITIDGTFQTYLYVKKDGYPYVVESGWYEQLTGFGIGVTVDTFAKKRPRNKTISEVSRAARIKGSRSRDDNRGGEDIEALVGEIGNDKYIKAAMTEGFDDLYDVFTLITINAPTHKEMAELQSYIKMTLSSHNIFVETLDYHMEEATQMALPLCEWKENIVNLGKRNFLTRSLASCYMYSAYEIMDKEGLMLGLNGSNSSFFAPNPWNTQRFSNGNGIILGTSGKGKSFLLMLLSYILRIYGNQVFMILPEKSVEWARMCEAMGGEFIRLYPGSSTRINLMAIRPAQELDDSFILDDYEEASLLSKKIAQVITFISLNLKKDELTDEEEASISTVLTQLYDEYGITDDNDSIWVDKENGILKTMPIIEDFYKKTLEDEILRQRVSVILRTYVEGDCRNMNGQTNVNLDNKFTILAVDKAGDKLAPFAFLAIDCAYDVVKANRIQRCAIILDEVWKMMINDYAGRFVMEIYKIIRGYSGIVISGTQELSDINKSESGAGIINNAKMKFFLGAEKRAIKSYEDIVDLSEDDKSIISKLARGSALFFANDDKSSVVIKAPHEWINLFTTDPNLLRKLAQENKKKKEGEKNATE